MSNPANPVHLGSYDLGEYADDINIRMVGNLAYVLDHGSGLQILDMGYIAQLN